MIATRAVGCQTGACERLTEGLSQQADCSGKNNPSALDKLGHLSLKGEAKKKGEYI